MAGYTRPSFARHLTEEPVEDGEVETTPAGVAQAGIVFPSLERADELVPGTLSIDCSGTITVWKTRRSTST